jgi:K+-transporting ATPase KdpF subunit
MSLGNIVVLVLTFAVLLYLLYSMLRPEEF